MPTLTLFVGVNGAGKSTLYNLLKPFLSQLGQRVNPDEILKAFKGDWKNSGDVFKSARVALEKISSCLDSKTSFNWETTLITDFVLKTVKQAKALGYNVNVFFVAVGSVDVALSRIKQRVKNGGHGITEQLVRFRYENQFYNIDALLKMANYALFFDNTDKLRLVGRYKNKTMTVLDKKFHFLKNKNNESGNEK